MDKEKEKSQIEIEQAALIKGAQPADFSPINKNPIEPMHDTTEGKPLWQSKTFWGIVLMLIARSFPKFAPFLGKTTIEQDVIIENVISVIGAIVALIGRLKATKPITLKK